MCKLIVTFFLSIFSSGLFVESGYAEILAMVNYHSRAPETLKTFKLTGSREPKEGIFILDVDPNSPQFAKTLMEIPLPSDFLSGKIFYDKIKTKAYVTSRGKSEMLVFKLDEFPFRLRKVSLPNCKVGQNLVFSEDNLKWFLTCRMSERVLIGRVDNDEVEKIIEIKDSYPHDVVILDKTSQLVVSSSLSTDYSNPHDFICIIDINLGREIFRQKVSKGGGGKPLAPADLLLIPKTLIPTIYIATIKGDSLLVATLGQQSKKFKIEQVFDFRSVNAGMPQELSYDALRKRLYVTTASKGEVYFFDVSMNALRPKYKKIIKTGSGANQIALTSDGRYGYIPNALFNFPGLADGSISVIDLNSFKVIRTMENFKVSGFNPNSIAFFPRTQSKR